MKLEIKKTLLNLVSTLAVVITIIFAVDVFAQVNSEQLTSDPSVASLALLMGLVTLTCVGATILFASAQCLWYFAFRGESRQLAMAKTAVHEKIVLPKGYTCAFRVIAV